MHASRQLGRYVHLKSCMQAQICNKGNNLGRDQGMLKCLKQEKTGLNRHKKSRNHASFSPENQYRAAVADMLSGERISLSRRCGSSRNTFDAVRHVGAHDPSRRSCESITRREAPYVGSFPNGSDVT